MIISSVKPDPLAVSVSCTDDALQATLADGRQIVVPLVWFPRLRHAGPQQRANWRLIGGGVGIHWPDVDEDISVENLLSITQGLALASSLNERATLPQSPLKIVSYMALLVFAVAGVLLLQWLFWRFALGIVGVAPDPWLYWGLITFTFLFCVWWDWRRRRRLKGHCKKQRGA